MDNKNTDLASKIHNLVQDSVGMTGTWEQNAVKWYKMRYRIKKSKNFPFVGCANIRMPTIEIKIRKLKAALLNSVFGVRPIVQVIPTPGGNWQNALKIEKFLDHLLMDVMKIQDKVIINIDQMLSKGFSLMKPYWKTRIEKRIENLSVRELSIEEALALYSEEVPEEVIIQEIIKRFDVDMHELVARDNSNEIRRVLDEVKAGKEEIKTTFYDVVCNYPDVALCDPETVYVPTDAGYSPQDAAWIVHEYYIPVDELKTNAEIKGWDVQEVEDLLQYKDPNNVSALDDRKLIDIEKDMREGITNIKEHGKVKIWEFYGKCDINGDGEYEESVVTLAADFRKVMRKMTNPFYTSKRPFVKTFYELTDDRWFSHRGIPELIEDIVKEIDMQHNQKLDQQTIRNTPMYVHRAGMINKNMMQFAFGQSIPVQGMQPLTDMIAPLNNSNSSVEFSYEREQMLLEAKIEEIIGQVDFSLQSMINKRHPRTLGEVQLQTQNMQQVFSLDATMLRASMEELFNWVWELWCQYGDEEYEFAYFGKDGYEPIKMTKEQLQGHYKIVVRGNDNNTNPQARIQKAQMILQSIQNPVAIQMGIINPMNIANAYKRMFQELEIPNWEEFISQPQPPQPPAPEVRINAKDLTDAEMADVLQKRGIAPDMQGRMVKRMQEAKDTDLDRRTKMAKNYTSIASTMSSLDDQESEEPELEEPTF